MGGHDTSTRGRGKDTPRGKGGRNQQPRSEVGGGNYFNGEFVQENANVAAKFIDTHVHWEYVGHLHPFLIFADLSERSRCRIPRFPGQEQNATQL